MIHAAHELLPFGVKHLTTGIYILDFNPPKLNCGK